MHKASSRHKLAKSVEIAIQWRYHLFFVSDLRSVCYENCKISQIIFFNAKSVFFKIRKLVWEKMGTHPSRAWGMPSLGVRSPKCSQGWRRFAFLGAVSDEDTSRIAAEGPPDATLASPRNFSQSLDKQDGEKNCDFSVRCISLKRHPNEMRAIKRHKPFFKMKVVPGS